MDGCPNNICSAKTKTPIISKCITRQIAIHSRNSCCFYAGLKIRFKSFGTQADATKMENEETSTAHMNREYSCNIIPIISRIDYCKAQTVSVSENRNG